MCSRHDLMKRGLPVEKWSDLVFDANEVVWKQRRFRKVSALHGLSDLKGSAGIYAEHESLRFFSLFTPCKGTLYVTDGTLIYTGGAGAYFDYKVFVTASWPMRVARMIRRFNRKEVFGTTEGTQIQYVGFLVEEATSCADAEILAQLSDGMLVIESAPETVSNLLDLFFLRQELNESSFAQTYRSSVESVDEAINQALKELDSISEPEKLMALREELLHLIESKHLLSLQEIDTVLNRIGGSLLR